jgi:hypothetical protein
MLSQFKRDALLNQGTPSEAAFPCPIDLPVQAVRVARKMSFKGQHAFFVRAFL